MTLYKLAANVVSFEPEVSPSKVDSRALRSRGWPDALVQCFERHQAGSDDLKTFEQNQVKQGEVGNSRTEKE
jgi:hypothetical protein